MNLLCETRSLCVKIQSTLRALLRELTGCRNHDWCAGLSTSGADALDFLDNIQAFRHISKDDVLSIKPRSFHSTEEKLTSVRVGSSIGHGKNSGASVRELKVFIGELVSVDGLASSSVVVGEVSSLAHEIRNHTVERTLGESKTLLSGAESTEILSRLGDNVGAKLHFDATSRRCADGNVKVYNRVTPVVSRSSQ
jgi:hypothetical protein